MRKITMALVAATMLATTPNVALAFDDDDRKEWRKDEREARKEWMKDQREDRKERMKDAREARKEWMKDQREARKELRGVGYDDDDDRRYRGRGNDWRAYRNYDYNRIDPRYGNYYADRYYRDGSNYRPRALAYNDRIYRGQNGQYYCRRPDGTTGLIIGGLAGGALGNLIAPGGSKTLGTVIGAVGGGLAGRALDRNRVVCR